MEERNILKKEPSDTNASIVPIYDKCAETENELQSKINTLYSENKGLNKRLANQRKKNFKP